MDKWKGISPFRISRCFTPHAFRSWHYAISCRTLDLSFTTRASYPVMGSTPPQGGKTPQNNFSQNSDPPLLKAM